MACETQQKENRDMTKYIFLPGPAYGHVNPTLAIAQELVRRGEQVVYYLTEEYQATIEATGATFHPYQSTMNNRQPPSRLPGNPIAVLRAMPLMRVKESQQVIPQVLERIRAEQADFILYDPMCLWARIVAQVLHIPAILLCPTYVTNEHFRLMPKQSTSTQTKPSEMFEGIQAELADLCAFYHLPPLDVRDILTHTEALNIVFMPRAFQPAGETFNERFVFVGPSIVLMEELWSVIGTQFFDGKRQSLAHLLKRLSHGLVTASQQHHAFTPSHGDINQLQRMPVLACAAFAAMMHQIPRDAQRAC